MPRLLDVADDFGPFEGRLWLNCSHQGPLPRVAVEAGREALRLKVAPHRLNASVLFNEVPAGLRRALGRLINAAPDDVILGNSASWTLNVLAAGLRWNEGDEVVVVRGDFPASVFPWLRLRDLGVNVRFVDPTGPVITADELESALSPATRLFCVSWVQSLSGWRVDAEALAAVCRSHGVLSVFNVSQGLGYRAFDVDAVGCDAVTCCGFKWLCGPYATGFGWIRPEVRDTLSATQGYWLASLTADELRGDFDYAIKPDLGARAYDVHCPANFNNFLPWTRSVEYLLDVGIDRIGAHDAALVARLIDGIDRDRFEIISPIDEPARTSLVVLRDRVDGETARLWERLRDCGIDVSLRRGALRVSPHLYNAPDDVGRLLDALVRAAH